MATFVLVHGAFGSSWHWSRLAPRLRAAGHRVYAPTLSGLGARAHLATPDLGLGTHIADVVGVLDYEGLRGAMLVGWSYGGMVVAGAAERAPARLGHVVHLDAYCPRDGQAAADQQPPPYREHREALLRAGTWLAPAPGAEALARYVERGQLTAEEVREFVARLRPQPVRTFLEPLRLTEPAAGPVPRTYVYCRQNTGDAWRAAAQRARPGWAYRELDADHLAPFTHPRAVADLLVEIAEAG
jgi:pimeloyl-ACP methyl ester carboxylesterase